MKSNHQNWSLPLALVVWCVTVAVAEGGSKDYHPVIDPANFAAAVDNPYFPLAPGSVYKYVEKSGKDTAETETTAR